MASIWNIAEGNVKVVSSAEENNDLTNLKFSFDSNGWILGQFDIKLNSSLQGKSFDLMGSGEEQVQILLAKGPANTDSSKKGLIILNRNN